MNRPPPPADCGVATVAPADEQRWNEAALAAPVRRPAWRLWVYREPAVVLGRSQRAWARDRGAGLEVLVRTAGGGAVLVGPWMLGVSALLPPAHALAAGGPVPSYRWLGEALALALQRCSVDALALSPEVLRARRGGRPAPAPDWACFGGLSPWEVLVGERKIAGLAQVRRREGVLLVAGVLVHPPPWDLLCDRLGQGADEALRLARATTSLADAQPAAASPRGAEALVPALVDAVDETLSRAAPSVPGR